MSVGISTVALSEIVWTLLCLSGVVHGWQLLRPIRRDLALLDSGRVRASAGARALFANDAAVEIDDIILFALLALAGVVALLRDNPEAGHSVEGWVTVALLFAAVIWKRYRSIQRGKRRDSVQVRHRQMAAPDSGQRRRHDD